MPLAFESRSHGTVAFGFFNVEHDMLLLDRSFFFATCFCEAVVRLAREGSATLAAYRAAGRAEAGDLHGAIAGVDLGGLIGETYRLWPFPARPEAFKQSPEGDRNREAVEAIARRHAEPTDLILCWDAGAGEVSVGEVRFDGPGFDALVAYVDRGGYPRWRDERRPAYVAAMLEALEASPPAWRALRSSSR